MHDCTKHRLKEITPSNYVMLPLIYCISSVSVIRQSFFSSKTVQKSRSILQDESRSLGLFRKDKTDIIAKIQGSDLII